jgi:hypothetical protein
MKIKVTKQSVKEKGKKVKEEAWGRTKRNLTFPPSHAPTSSEWRSNGNLFMFKHSVRTAQ